MALDVGETLGRYQLEQLVGQGGMAVVYRAVDSVLGRTVAVKVIRPAYTEDPHFLDRFLQEARVVASLDHPNILPLYDFGEEKGRPYLVLPYLPGGSLADRMGSEPQPLALVAAWMIQLAGALDAAHARGVMHRDIKPGNVLITKDGRLMLGDFGIARLVESTTRLTATGMVVGTPIYMAPELARGADASPASDRYALAVLAYEMLAGLPPFVGTNALSVLHQQVHEPVPALSGRLLDLPPGIDAFLRRALAKSPAARHPSARAMADELVQLLTPEQRAELSTLVWSGVPEKRTSTPDAPTFVPSGGTLRMSGPTGPTVVRPSTSAATAMAPRARRFSPALWALLAVVAIAGLVLLLPQDLLTGAKGGSGDGREQASSATSGGAAPASEPGASSGAPNSPDAASASGGATGKTLTETGGAPSGAPGASRPVAPQRPAVESPGPGEALTAEPPAAGGLLGSLQPLRRPPGRASVGAFEQGLMASASLENNPRLRAGVGVFREWARGGLAYARGDRSAARSVADGLPTSMSAPGVIPWGIAWPVTVFPHDRSWYLAALYGDSRSELEGLLQRELASGGDNYTHLASAYLAHLDGNHRGAIVLLQEAGLDPLRGRGPSEAQALAAQFLAAEAAELGEGPAAKSWMPIALGQGRAPLAAPFALEMVGLASERLGPGAAQEVKNIGCRMGVSGLCPPTLQPSVAQPVERPRLKPDRFGPRRRFGGNKPGARPIPTSPGPRRGGSAEAPRSMNPLHET